MAAFSAITVKSHVPLAKTDPLVTNVTGELRKFVTLHGSLHGTESMTYWQSATQFSSSSAGTRSNSATLLVTSTKPSLLA